MSAHRYYLNLIRIAHSRTQRKRLKNGAVPSRNLPMTYDLKKSLRMNRNESNR